MLSCVTYGRYTYVKIVYSLPLATAVASAVSLPAVRAAALKAARQAAHLAVVGDDAAEGGALLVCLGEGEGKRRGKKAATTFELLFTSFCVEVDRIHAGGAWPKLGALFFYCR